MIRTTPLAGLAFLLVLGIGCTGHRSSGPAQPSPLAPGSYQLALTVEPAGTRTETLGALGFRLALPAGLTVDASPSGALNANVLQPGADLPTGRVLSGAWQGDRRELRINVAVGSRSAWKGEALRITFQVPAGVSVTEADLVAANSPLADRQYLGLDAAGQNTTVFGADFVTRLKVIPKG